MASRSPRCPGLVPGEIAILVNRPETSSGIRRPRRALLQSVVVVSPSLHRVSSTRYAHRLGGAIGESVTLLFEELTAHPKRGHHQMGSSAGAVHPRKDIEGSQSSAHPGQKSGVECKHKSWADWISTSERSSRESVG